MRGVAAKSLPRTACASSCRSAPCMPGPIPSTSDHLHGGGPQPVALGGIPYPVGEADVARLSPLVHEHINMLGRYSFAMPETVARGELRPLRNPAVDQESPA